MLSTKTEYDGRNAEHLISGEKLGLGGNAGWRNKSRVNSGLVLYIGLLKLLPVEPEIGHNTLKL